MNSLTDRRNPPPDRFDRRLYAPMMLGAILNPINSSIIAVALVPIGIALGAPASETAWLVSALYVATAIGQPLMGSLIDQFGSKRLFLIGAFLTTVAGILGALAPNIWVLMVARVVLGFGTCAGYPSAMRLIKYESHRTGIETPAAVLSVLTITTQVISVIGPTLGGALIGLGGWRSTMTINVVLGAAAFVLGALFLPAHDSSDDSDVTTDTDLIGILLFSVTLISALLFFMNLAWPLAWLLLVSVAFGAAFAWWEMKRRAPFIDVRVFAGNVPLMATYVRAFLAQSVSYAFIYGYTQWLEQGRGLSASTAGLLLLPTFGTGILVTLLTGRFAEVRLKLKVGALAQIVACALIMTLADDAPVWLLVVVALILGIPQGLVSLANQNAVYFQAREDKIGASAGLLRTFMYFGAMAASSASGFFFGQKATTSGLHELGLFMVVLATLFAVMTWVDRSLRRART